MPVATQVSGSRAPAPGRRGQGLWIIFAVAFVFFLVEAILARLAPSAWHGAGIAPQIQSVFQKATSSAYVVLNFALMG